MDVALYFFVPLIFAAAVLTSISIWSPRSVWLKLSALVATAAFIPLAYGSLSELLSRPKPVSLEWARRAAPEATLLAASLEEGKAIYLWLRVPESPEPRAYRMPWSLEMAKQLQSAQRAAKANRTGVRVRKPFEGTDDPRKRMFYASPQSPLPRKPRPTENFERYVHPSKGP